VDVTPKQSNVRTRVHEYGGGAFLFASDNDDTTTLFFSEFATQQLCKLSLTEDGNKEPEPITPKSTTGAYQYRFADGVYDEKRKVIFCVREDHGEDGSASPKDVKNEVVAVDVATGKMRVLVTGYDFVSNPRLSPDGMKLACIVWNHPNMYVVLRL
jgi:Tol biopolymer transport system component